MTPQSGRRSFLWLCSFLVVCATVSAGAAGEYRTIEVESLKITFDSEWGARTTPGYLPVRFDITNLGEARVIEIPAHGSRFFRPSGRAGVSSTGVRLGRQKVGERSLPSRRRIQQRRPAG